MRNDVHGKRYYMELRNESEVRLAMAIVNDSSLADEGFHVSDIYVNDDGILTWLFESGTKCDGYKGNAKSFRGQKYRDWEGLKRKIYTRRSIRDICQRQNDLIAKAVYKYIHGEGQQ